MSVTADDVSRETSPVEELEASPAPDAVPVWVADELNRVFKRLGHVVDLMERLEGKADELLTDSRAARPLLDRALKGPAAWMIKAGKK